MCIQRSALISPRRRPVIIVSHSNIPQSGSAHAAFRIRAASAALGGSGFGRLGEGAFAKAALLTPRCCQRTPRSSAALMIWCICRTVALASGRHV
jgi:hypothetical protein